jgi:hypothetical protein
MIYFDTNFLIQTVVAGSAAHEKFRAWTQAQGEYPDNDPGEVADLEEVEGLLDERLGCAEDGAISRRSVGEIFRNAYRKSKGDAGVLKGPP